MKKSSSIGVGNKRRYSGSLPKVVSQNTLVTEDDSKIILRESKKKLNYEEELVLFIYYYLLEIIIDDYKVISPQTKGAEEEECTTDEEIIKNFYDLDVNELKNAELLYVSDTKVAYSKQSIKKASFSSNKIFNKVNLNESKSEYVTTDLPDLSESLDEYWLVPHETENVIIKYINGNVYEGTTYRKLFHGMGVYKWHDGVTYEGEFRNGEATGKGVLYLSDLSYYKGEVCKGLIHGMGTLYVSLSPLLYNGNWKAGKKHGRGWLLYGNDNWYDGEWEDNKSHGWGFRQYNQRVRYKGNWCKGHRHGLGTLVYDNGDFYSGEWKLGLNDGYGEYTWKAFLNRSFSFALENIYQGMWANGTRDGAGIMHFGIDGGVRLTGLWRKNQKNGPGILICRNGSIVQGCPLFVADKPIHVDRYESMSLLNHVLIEDNDFHKMKEEDDENLTNFEMLSRKLFMNNSLHSISDIPKYKPMCNPINIPIYAPPETLYLKRYIDKLIFKYDNMKNQMHNYIIEAEERSKLTTIRTWASYTNEKTEYQLKLNTLNDPLDETIEEALFRRYLRKNAYKLHKLYIYYSSLCLHEPVDYDIILIRLFLWQVYRDLGLIEKYSMVEIDTILYENEDIGLELQHNPFEKIYYWQFLHCLIEIALFSYEHYENMIDFKETGILTSIFQQFVDDFIEKSQLASKNLYNPYIYINLLPIESTYLLYESVGQPHSARTFLRHCCLKDNEPFPCQEGSSKWEPKRQNVEGINMVPLGENITFYQKTAVNLENPIQPIEENHFRDLYVFGRLGAKRIIQCLSAVCPLITIDCLVVNMEYQLTFLEFFETLIFCSYLMVDEKIENERLLKEETLSNKRSEVIEEIPQKMKKRRSTVN